MMYLKTSWSAAGLKEGDFLEYRLEASIMVLWNYTLEDGVIRTFPGRVLYAVKNGVGVINVVSIRIEVLAEPESGMLSILLSYRADTEVGYVTHHSVLASYYTASSICTVENGTLAGHAGLLCLFSNNQWSGREFIISSLDGLDVKAMFVEGNVTSMVMGEAHVTSYYDCNHTHIVDDVVSHGRNYDLDSHVLVKAGGGIADMILLGLSNLSYCVGRLDLIDTNLDIGPPHVASSLPASTILGVALLGVFGVLYVAIYRTQRRSSSLGVRKKKSMKKRRRTNKLIQRRYHHGITIKH